MEDCKQTDLIDLIEDIENIETFKVIAMIECSEWLNKNVCNFETIDELKSQVGLEYGKSLECIVKNIVRVNWLEVLLYFKLKQKTKE